MIEQSEDQAFLIRPPGAVLHTMDQTSCCFFLPDGKKVLELCSNGDIFVHGRPAGCDLAVVDGLRAFLSGLPRSR